MNIRGLILEEAIKKANISKESQAVIDRYRHNEQVYDSYYDLYPLYALMKIMVYTKRYAFVIARKNLTQFLPGDDVRNNYVLYKAYMEDYGIASDEFRKHLILSDDEREMVEEVKDKLEKSIAVRYTDDIDLFVDIFDMDSSLYKVEGIEYAR